MPLTPRFGPWLLAQHERDDWIGWLGRYAARNPRFPKAGAPLEVFEHVRKRGGDLEAAIAALREWNDGEPYPLAAQIEAARQAKVRAGHEAFLATLPPRERRELTRHLG